MSGDFAANPGEVTGFGGVTTMQALTTAACKTAVVGTEGQLRDTRDNKIYWVARLKDNNCWMVQNLDYDGGGLRYGSPWSFTSNNTKAYYDPGEVGANLEPVSDEHLLLGNYYTWMAATNGTGDSATTDGANATGSICPTNWKLPTSNSTASGSFGGLTSGLNFNTIQAAPYYFVAGGFVNSGGLNNAGSEGRYWSSTANGSSQAYDLRFESSAVNPSGSNSRYLGLSVRCLVIGS